MGTGGYVLCSGVLRCVGVDLGAGEWVREREGEGEGEGGGEG